MDNPKSAHGLPMILGGCVLLKVLCSSAAKEEELGEVVAM
jgi:hypothetical protein